MAIKVANNNSLSAITALPSAVSGGAMTLISTTTASSSATVDITSGIDSTYKEYIIRLYDVHPATDDTHFSMQFNAAGGSGFNETITSTHFKSTHGEDDSSAEIGYDTGGDQAQGTSYQRLSQPVGNGNDECLSGIIHLYDPSSTTFVKHFMSRMVYYYPTNQAHETYVAGYVNTTTAIDEISFKFLSGNIDAGTFKLYGVS
tara:strand:- start:614 stop:1219 length:606 start_codon:yes stop_codon:yes gene_type:complete